MKKVLLATTAISAISMIGVASAQESAMMSAAGNSITIGGYYEFGYASVSDDVDSEEGGDSYTYGESELFIDFETTSDSGLTYGVQIDLEVVNGNQHDESGTAKNAEESSLYISGDFGTLHFGHDDNAYGRFLTWAPTHEGATSQDDNVHYGAITSVDDGSGGRRGLNLARTAAGQGPAYNDAAKVTYVSPNFSGFKFGASVADSDSAADNPTAFGASYSMDVADISLTFTASTASNNADDAAKSDHTAYGVTASTGNLTLSAARYDGDDAGVDRKATELGIGYQVSDALSIGASTNSAESEGTGVDHEGDFQSVSGSYSIAPGLKTTVALNQYEVSDNDATVSNDGSELVWQIEFAF